jgi:serine phosphatase RsbU (regulator of sigma subunit)
MVTVDVPGQTGRSEGHAWNLAGRRHSGVLVELCWRSADGVGCGDFFESALRVDATVGVILGDAAGFGAAASGLAERIAADALCSLQAGERPRQVLARLDGGVQASGFDALATSICLAADPATGWVELSSAGHLPALVARPGGAEFVDAVGLPLGMAGERAATGLRLGGEDTLYLFTDGLVERRGRRLDVGLDVARRLAGGLGSARSWASELVRETLEVLGAPSDDVMVASIKLDHRRDAHLAAVPAA